jgi:hypothetical protein
VDGNITTDLITLIASIPEWATPLLVSADGIDNLSGADILPRPTASVCRHGATEKQHEARGSVMTQHERSEELPAIHSSRWLQRILPAINP